MHLPRFAIQKSLRGTRVLIRVDWNVPINGSKISVDSIKIQRTLKTVDELSKKGAIVIVLTHLGRPKKRDTKLSTKKLASAVQSEHGVPITFLDARLEQKQGLEDAQNTIAGADAGTVFLLENVRFFKGEQKNAVALSKAYASLADTFIFEAFGVSHRDHSSISGVQEFLPSFAGPSLIAEIEAIEKLLKKNKKPFYAVVGGAKLSSKIGVIKTLLKSADKVFVGGALAHPFFRAQGFTVGKSRMERNVISIAATLMKKKNLILPTDVLVSNSITNKSNPKNKLLVDVIASDTIGDIGVETMKTWSREIQKAKTIVWNGPVGALEFAPFSHGSRLIAHTVAKRGASKSVFSIVGGGDTLPVIQEMGFEKTIDFVSTGGGAMLEFIAKDGKLPGLIPLQKNI